MKRSQIKRRPLSDTTLASLEPEAKEYRERDSEGLYLRVKPDGSKSWQLRYKRPDGSWSWMGLGGYGRGSHQLTGEQARRKAREILESASSGQTPLQNKQALKKQQQLAAETSFESVAKAWLDIKGKSWVADTATRNIGALNKHVLPVFGHRPITEILPTEWMKLLQDMQAKGTIEQAKRVRCLCRDIYDYACVMEKASSNPLQGLHKFLQSKPAENYSHVSAEEFPALLLAIRSYPHAPDIRLGLQLLALLFCRPSELREASWDEFDLNNKLWTIPAERMKRRREHLIPLPEQAVALLKELHLLSGKYRLLFPGRSNVNKPRSDTAFLMALRRLDYEGRQTSHGFRHLASTILNEKGFNPEHIEAQLSHVKVGVRGVYDKSIYLDQRRVMMQWYADYLDEMTGSIR